MTILVLASASPARRKLLAAAGLEPSIVVSSVDEDTADKLKRAGFNWLAFGIEAASDRVLGDVDKRYVALVRGPWRDAKRTVNRRVQIRDADRIQSLRAGPLVRLRSVDGLPHAR